MRDLTQAGELRGEHRDDGQRDSDHRQLAGDLAGTRELGGVGGEGVPGHLSTDCSPDRCFASVAPPRGTLNFSSHRPPQT